VSRLLFNKTVALLKDGTVKSSWRSIKTDLITSLPDWSHTAPYQVRSIAIRDACLAVSAAKKKFLKTGEFQEVSFRRKHTALKSIYIPSSAVKPSKVRAKSAKIYFRLLGDVRLAEKLPESHGDCRLVISNGEYFLNVSYKATFLPNSSENQTKVRQRVVALDPGIRSFVTFFAENSFGKIGQGDIGRIGRLCYYLDSLYSKIAKATSKSKYRMRKAAARIRKKVRNLIDELHHKSAAFLTSNYDLILLPKFETSKMVQRSYRKIRSKTARAMLTFAHYKFKMFLNHKANENNAKVLEVCEAYTSKTKSWSGEIVKNLGGNKYIKEKDLILDRDFNGARNILVKTLSGFNKS
jgi:putative transposase